jgi:hypothetical protein
MQCGITGEGPSIHSAELLSDAPVLCLQCQAAAVHMLLSLFRLCILAIGLGEGYVQRLMPEADSEVFSDTLFISSTDYTYREPL